MKSTATIISASAFVALILAAVIYIQVGVWHECRAEGRSFFYCMNLVKGR